MSQPTHPQILDDASPPPLYSCEGCPPGTQCVWCRRLEAARRVEADALDVPPPCDRCVTVSDGTRYFCQLHRARPGSGVSAGEIEIVPVTASYPLEALLAADELEDAQALEVGREVLAGWL